MAIEWFHENDKMSKYVKHNGTVHIAALKPEPLSFNIMRSE
jgi:hypothetical protein